MGLAAGFQLGGGPGVPAGLPARGRNYLTSWAQYHWLKYYDDRYRRLFARTGLLIGAGHDIARLFAQAAEHLSPTIAGEAIPTVGKGVAAEEEGYDGIIAIGPFNCLPFRISEAILKPHSLSATCRS